MACVRSLSVVLVLGGIGFAGCSSNPTEATDSVGSSSGTTSGDSNLPTGTDSLPEDDESSSTTEADESSSSSTGTPWDDPIETCEATAVDHSGECGRGCPIVLDTRVTCDARQLADPGLRVAPAADATLLATASDYNAWLMRITPDEFVAEVLPESFTRTTLNLALDAEGSPHIAAFTRVNDPVEIHVLGPDGTLEVLLDAGDVFDFELGPDGEPHVWHLSYPDQLGVERIRTAPDTWTERSAPVPGMTGWHRYTLDLQGESVGFDFVDSQGQSTLAMLADDETSLVSSGFGPSFPGAHIFVSAPAVPALDDTSIPFVILAEHDDGLRLSWPLELGFEEVALPDTGPLGQTCVIEPDEDDTCAPTCTETGAGVEPRMSAVTRTSDGRVWLTWMETHLDQDIEYTASCDKEVGCHCNSDVVREDSTADLVLAEFDLETLTVGEVLRVSDTNPNLHGLFASYRNQPRSLDMRAFGQELAIAARVREGGRFDPPAVRVLRVDTSTIE